jgi:hypothetical protein
MTIKMKISSIILLTLRISKLFNNKVLVVIQIDLVISQFNIKIQQFIVAVIIRVTKFLLKLLDLEFNKLKRNIVVVLVI